MLGTVQFGMPYGVANRHWSRHIRGKYWRLWQGGPEAAVNCFDTGGRLWHERGSAGPRAEGIESRRPSGSRDQSAAPSRRGTRRQRRGGARESNGRWQNRDSGCSSMPAGRAVSPRGRRRLRDVLAGLGQRAGCAMPASRVTIAPVRQRHLLQRDMGQRCNCPPMCSTAAISAAGISSRRPRGAWPCSFRSVYLQGLLLMPRGRHSAGTAQCHSSSSAAGRDRQGSWHAFGRARPAVHAGSAWVTCVLTGVEPSRKSRESGDHRPRPAAR